MKAQTHEPAPVHYTKAEWRVKPGREEEFVAAWLALSDTFASLPRPPIWGTLLRSDSEPSVFYSFGPWANLEDVQAMRADPGSHAAICRVVELCDSATPGPAHVVGHVDLRPDNKRIIQRFYDEVWNRGNVDVALEIFADDYIRHELRSTQAAPGGEGQRQVAAAFRRAFPDLRFETEILISEGDIVAARWSASGTHTGLWAEVPQTGRRIRFSGVNIFRLRDGKVVEIWNHRDDLGLMEQIGAPVYAGAPPAEARSSS